MRRPNCGMNRRGSGARGIGGAPFSPLDLGAILLEWHDHQSLAAGAVASWVGKKAGIALAQVTGSLQPIKGATGVVFDGTDDILSAAFGSILNGRAAARLVLSGFDASTAVKVWLEYSTNSNNIAGGFGFLVNDGVGDRIEGNSFNVSQSLAFADSQPLSTVKVISIGIDYSQTQPIRFIRINKVAQSLTQSGTVTATTLGNHSLFLGARSGGTLPAALTLRQKLWLSGVAQDADLDRIESFCMSEAAL